MMLDKRTIHRFCDKAGRPDPHTGCMMWTASLNYKGYGRFRYGNTMIGAHRVAYVLYHGPIPEGLVIDHLCRNRACVNPRHLEAVTPGENSRRGEVGQKSGVQMRSKTHCPQGHEYTPENTHYNKQNHRHCRTCGREYARKKRKGTPHKPGR